MLDPMALAHHPADRRLSLVWSLIESQKTGLARRAVYWALLLSSVIFSLPRGRDVWLVWVAAALPLSMAAMLELIRHLQAALGRIRRFGLQLMARRADQRRLQAWWTGLDRRVQTAWALLFAVLLGSLSLIFNANQTWSRYTDALAFACQGFVAGEITYLLALVPLWTLQLKLLPLRLNPVDPVNTADLRALADTVFGVALITGISLLAVNSVIAMASYLFPHLKYGVIFISGMAWFAVILLAGYPQLIFVEMVQAAKQASLRALEQKLARHYRQALAGKASPGLNDTLKLYELLLNSKAVPISLNAVFGVSATVLLNLVPVLTQYVNR